jgi:hypothetical protein
MTTQSFGAVRRHLPAVDFDVWMQLWIGAAGFYNLLNNLNNMALLASLPGSQTQKGPDENLGLLFSFVAIGPEALADYDPGLLSSS